MTKKAERAERIAADKRTAWDKKVRLLLGHVYATNRIPLADLNTAYIAGTSAETYAAAVASREPVGRAVHPLKLDAIKRASDYAADVVEKTRQKLEANGWDANEVAPYPSSHMSAADYAVKINRYRLVSQITRSLVATRNHGAPRIVEMNPNGIAQFIHDYEANAALQYDAFILKLVTKVGECLEAKLDGSHVWSESTLTVTKEGGAEKWRTHQIENVSKLGKYFPQWPTRLLKGDA